MSSDNFAISTRAMYNIFHVAWILMIVLFLIRISITIVQPTDISIPIHFSIQDAGNVVGYENHKISITSAEGLIKYDKAYQPPMLTIIAYQFKSLFKFALIVFIFSQIRLILKNTIDLNPFNNKNSQRLYWIGLAILTIGLLKIFTMLFTYYHIDPNNLILDKSVENYRSDSFNVGYRLGKTLISSLLSPYIYMGLVTIVLSKVFTTGTTLKEQVDLTI